MAGLDDKLREIDPSTESMAKLSPDIIDARHLPSVEKHFDMLAEQYPSEPVLREIEKWREKIRIAFSAQRRSEKLAEIVGEVTEKPSANDENHALAA